MAHTAAHTHRTTVLSKRHAAAPKKRVISGRKAASVRHAKRTGSRALKDRRPRGKASSTGMRKRVEPTSATRKRTRAIATRGIAPRGKTPVIGPSLRKVSANSRKKFVLARKLRITGGLRRPAIRMTTERKAPRRRRIAPRLWRCAACGMLVPWVSVDSRCFPCLKRGLAGRKREDEFAMGVFDIEEEFAPAVQ
jgi:hypothetical protein